MTKNQDTLDKLKANFYESSWIRIFDLKKDVCNILIGENIHADSEKKFYNKLLDEICPTLLVSIYMNANKVKFTGTQCRYDATLQFLADDFKKVDKKVEVTVAIDVYKKTLISEYLKKYQHANLFEDIEKNGTEDRRRFKEQKGDGGRCLDAALKDELLPMLIERLKDKIEKSKSNCDYHKAILVVAFDDMNFAMFPEDRPILYTELFSRAVRAADDINRVFDRVFIVGLSGRCLWDNQSGELIIKDERLRLW